MSNGGGAGSYSDYIEQRAAESSGQPMFSRTAEHGYLAVLKIIDRSRNKISVLTKDLNEEIFITPDMAGAVESFLLRNPEATINVISTMEVPRTHPINNFLLDVRFAGRVLFRVLSSEHVPTYYFIVGDSQNFRFETVGGSYQAIVAFGDKVNGEALQSRFEELQIAMDRTENKVRFV